MTSPLSPATRFRRKRRACTERESRIGPSCGDQESIPSGLPQARWHCRNSSDNTSAARGESPWYQASKVLNPLDAAEKLVSAPGSRSRKKRKTGKGLVRNGRSSGHARLSVSVGPRETGRNTKRPRFNFFLCSARSAASPGRAAFSRPTFCVAPVKKPKASHGLRDGGDALLRRRGGKPVQATVGFRRRACLPAPRCPRSREEGLEASKGECRRGVRWHDWLARINSLGIGLA